VTICAGHIRDPSYLSISRGYSVLWFMPHTHLTRSYGHFGRQAVVTDRSQESIDLVSSLSLKTIHKMRFRAPAELRIDYEQTSYSDDPEATWDANPRTACCTRATKALCRAARPFKTQQECMRFIGKASLPGGSECSFLKPHRPIGMGRYFGQLSQSPRVSAA